MDNKYNWVNALKRQTIKSTIFHETEVLKWSHWVSCGKCSV